MSGLILAKRSCDAIKKWRNRKEKFKQPQRTQRARRKQNETQFEFLIVFSCPLWLFFLLRLFPPKSAELGQGAGDAHDAALLVVGQLVAPGLADVGRVTKHRRVAAPAGAPAV